MENAKNIRKYLILLEKRKALIYYLKRKSETGLRIWRICGFDSKGQIVTTGIRRRI